MNISKMWSMYYPVILAFLSFLYSVTLWFTGNKLEGIFVGIWVPSILGFSVAIRQIRRDTQQEKQKEWWIIQPCLLSDLSFLQHTCGDIFRWSVKPTESRKKRTNSEYKFSLSSILWKWESYLRGSTICFKKRERRFFWEHSLCFYLRGAKLHCNAQITIPDFICRFNPNL